jgi:hypothetical protein
VARQRLATGQQELDLGLEDEPAQIRIRAGNHVLTTADPLTADLRDAVKEIRSPEGAHLIEPTQVTPSLCIAAGGSESERGSRNSPTAGLPLEKRYGTQQHA